MSGVVSYQVPATITGPEAPAKAPAETPAEKPSEKAAERPAYVPEKFFKDGKVDVEAMAKSYAELEKMRGKGGITVKEDAKVEATKGDEKPKADEKADGEGKPKEDVKAPEGEASEIPGITKAQSDSFTEEFSKDGKLSDASYEALKKAGYSKAVVDNHIRGLQADQASQANGEKEMKALAGGEAGYSEMANWMVSTLTPQEISDYDDAVSSGKTSIITNAIKQMHGRYTEALGSDPKLLSGRGNDGVSGEVFNTRAEMTAAMRDPKYKKDASYRREVEAKVKRSSI
ncbi:MAG: capsid assembly protein [Cetobacterium sp.]